ncbi:MAG: hypothetical protein NC099_04740 [Corallococcus sp.]|nr:hypothetical protein [Corallococcus sp.]
MAKIKRTFSLVLILFVLVSSCLVMAGCPHEKEEKYDIVLKISCRQVINEYKRGPDLDEWIFTPDVSEYHIQRKYDGNQYVYYVSAYNLPDHPRDYDRWPPPYPTPNRPFETDFGKEGKIGPGEERPKYVCTPGNYIYTFRVNGAYIFNPRVLKLFITVV